MSLRILDGFPCPDGSVPVLLTRHLASSSTSAIPVIFHKGHVSPRPSHRGPSLRWHLPSFSSKDQRGLFVCTRTTVGGRGGSEHYNRIGILRGTFLPVLFLFCQFVCLRVLYKSVPACMPACPDVCMHTCLSACLSHLSYGLISWR